MALPTFTTSPGFGFGGQALTIGFGHDFDAGFVGFENH